jgi:hypothetical protein
MKAYRAVEIYVHAFWTLALLEAELSALCPSCLHRQESAAIACSVGNWLGPRDSLDAVEKKKILTTSCQGMEPDSSVLRSIG